MSKAKKDWYVVTNCTSWVDVEVALFSGPYATKEEAQSQCIDSSYWPELMTKEEASKITY